MLLAMFVAFAADAWTVKFTNPDGWSTVYCHAWNGARKLAGEWPGTKMELVDGVYTVTVPNQDVLPLNVLFNSGGDNNKTSNFDFVDGATYDKNGITKYPGKDVTDSEPNTIYFCNKDGWSDVYLYFEGLEGEVVTWPGNKMTLTDMTYLGKQVYTYVFPEGKTPSKVIISNGKNQDSGAGGQETAGITSFQQGRLYIFNGNKVNPTTVDNPVYQLKEKTYTIYFFDKNGLDGVNVRIWDEGGNHYREDAMVNTGKYVYDGVNYWPAYSYTFTTANIPAYIRFRDITGDMRFVNGAFYTNTDFDRPSSITYQLVDKRDEEKFVYLYVNMAEDWLSKADTSYKPHCHVFNNKTGDTYINKGWYQEENNSQEEMTNVRYQIWEYRIDRKTFEEKGFDDAIFYVKLKDGSIAEYRASAKNTDGEWDSDNWAKYIYGLSYVGSNRFTRQSYLTYSQFVALDNAGRHNLYLLGSGGGLPGWNLDDPKPYGEDDGVFYIEIDLEKSASFKLSWLNPAEAANTNNYSNHNDPRLWATFDLGLIGVADDSPLFENGTLNKDYIESNGNKCFFPLRVSLPYNNYNQFDWVVDIDRTELKAGKYWVVVDTHPGCRTLTLISFDPNPSIEVKAGDVRTVDLNMTRAAQVHSADNHFHGAEMNGHQYLNRVNVSSGDVTIVPSAMPEEFRDDFTIEYTVLMNGEDAATVGTAGTVHLDYLPSAASITAGVRAMYTSHKTDLTFHSRTGKGNMSSEVTLPEPSVEFVDGIHRHDGQNADGTYDMHAVVMAKYNGPETEKYAYFADFDADAKGVNTPVLCHSGMEWINDPGEEALYYLGQGEEYASWVPKTSGEGDFEDANCWAAIIRDSHQLPFYLPAVQQVDAPKNVQSVEGNLTVYAVYPFLVRTKEIVQTDVVLADARDGESAAAVEVPEDLSGFTLVNIRKPAETKFSIPGGRLTGVEEVAIEDVEAEPEYYTISGVRVQGRLEPGIYICRKGNEVEKIYVR